MKQRYALAIAFAAAASAIAVVLLDLSVDRSDIYAPGAGNLTHGIAQLAAGQSGFLRSPTLALVILLCVRKFWSIVAFAALGFFLAPVFRVRSAGRVAVFVLAFSAVIEIVQHVAGSNESFVTSAFDVACGFVGGWFGAGLWNWMTAAPPVVARPRKSFEP